MKKILTGLVVALCLTLAAGATLHARPPGGCVVYDPFEEQSITIDIADFQ